LIEKGSEFSSKSLEDVLHEIRKLTHSLGKDHGRVVLKAIKPHLEERLAKFGEELKVHQAKVEKDLQVKSRRIAKADSRVFRAARGGQPARCYARSVPEVR
jgi:hypothetical protein